MVGGNWRWTTGAAGGCDPPPKNGQLPWTEAQPPSASAISAVTNGLIERDLIGIWLRRLAQPLIRDGAGICAMAVCSEAIGKRTVTVVPLPTSDWISIVP